MRLQSKREQAEQARAMSILRGKIRDLEAELLEQGRANGRLAGRTAAAEGAIAGATAALTVGRRELREENSRLRTTVDRQRATITRLQSRLDDALGRSPEDIRVLDAGGHAAAAKAAAAEKASAAR
ncbi:hypothetical protein [Kitasatospora indigofera]|uniref:hypothetical protein n=1 Tax=Kitasatospora indigofera TaxID=67307 RepID=UPI0036AC7E0D